MQTLKDIPSGELELEMVRRALARTNKALEQANLGAENLSKKLDDTTLLAVYLESKRLSLEREIARQQSRITNPASRITNPASL